MQRHLLSFQDEARAADKRICVWITGTALLHIKPSLLSQSEGEAENSS